MTKVTVNGVGKIKGKPDVALIDVKVQNEHANMVTCRLNNNASSEEVVATLKKVIAENDIYAVPARVTPQYKSGFLGTKVIGHTGINTISATLRDLDAAQELIKELNSLDAETVQVSSFQFDIEDKEELENRARQDAFHNAKKRAELYAQEIGLPVSGVDTLEESVRYGSTARHPSGKFAAARLHEQNDFWIPTREGETLEMGDIELTIDVRVCFLVGESPARTDVNGN